MCEKNRSCLIRDHCHLTEQYRGLTHSNCDLNYKDSYCIPTIFYNLSGYDAHFIIKDIATAYKTYRTKEKYISFTKYVDSTKNEKKLVIKTFYRFIM